jgi:DNA-binding NarL/FixJ family response regulator
MKREVLLVEDEVDARESLARAFEREGYMCLLAATYDEAVSVSAGHELALAVVDIVLGADDGAGLRLLPVIRSLVGRPPVIIVTAFADVARVKAALNGGASYLLEKPFRASDLLEVAMRVLSERGDFQSHVDAAITRAKLTEKEAEVARLLLKGLTAQEIATLGGNSDKTIRQHITQIYAKCGVSSRPEFFHFVFPS